jgi:hypothetical protein
VYLALKMVAIHRERVWLGNNSSKPIKGDAMWYGGIR